MRDPMFKTLSEASPDASQTLNAAVLEDSFRAWFLGFSGAATAPSIFASPSYCYQAGFMVCAAIGGINMTNGHPGPSLFTEQERAKLLEVRQICQAKIQEIKSKPSQFTKLLQIAQTHGKE